MQRLYTKIHTFDQQRPNSLTSYELPPQQKIETITNQLPISVLVCNGKT